MRTLPLIALVTLSGILPACDERTGPVTPSNSSGAASKPAAAATQRSATRRISLLAIPFTAEVPDGWDVRSGPGGKIVLNGRTPDGTELDVILSTRDKIKAEALPGMLAKLKAQPATTSADMGALRHRVEDRGQLKFIEQTERLGPADQPGDLVPFQWTLQIVVLGNTLDYPFYELNVTNLSQVLYERNESFLRGIFDTIQYDPSAIPGV